MNGKRDPVVTTAAICGAAALLAMGAGAALGSWRVGLAVAIGLAVGPVNGFLAKRAMAVDLSFGATSIGRLVLLSAVAFAVAVGVLGLPMVPFVLLGIAAAQLVLAVVAGVAVVRA